MDPILEEIGKMKKWEYMIIDSDDRTYGGLPTAAARRDSLQAGLNRLGEEGWEAVTIDFSKSPDRLCGVLKREVA